MDSMICRELEDGVDMQMAQRQALRYMAREHATALACSRKDGPNRITWRLWLIETLEACKIFGDYFWRDVLIGVRETMELESKRGNDS